MSVFPLFWPACDGPIRLDIYANVIHKVRMGQTTLLLSVATLWALAQGAQACKPSAASRSARFAGPLPDALAPGPYLSPRHGCICPLRPLARRIWCLLAANCFGRVGPARRIGRAAAESFAVSAWTSDNAGQSPLRAVSRKHLRHGDAKPPVPYAQRLRDDGQRSPSPGTPSSPACLPHVISRRATSDSADGSTASPGLV
jgi:hypothetical protein